MDVPSPTGDKDGAERVCNTQEYTCYCGRQGRNRNTLSWVHCNKCFEPMHGRCAGFETEQSLLSSTNLSHSKNVESIPIRFCHFQRCPSCSNHKFINGGEELAFVSSRATLIITPPSIMGQWEREIRRHTAIDKMNSGEVSPLKVVVYTGVKEICQLPLSDTTKDKDRKLINAHNLADADSKLSDYFFK